MSSKERHRRSRESESPNNPGHCHWGSSPNQAYAFLENARRLRNTIMMTPANASINQVEGSGTTEMSR